MRVPKERDAVPPSPVELSKVLMVEGDTPSHFFEWMTKELGINRTIEIRMFTGNDSLEATLRILASTAEFKAKVSSLGIIRDAETDIGLAKRAVEKAIAKANLLSGVRHSYFILPDNTVAGMIETLLIRTINTNPLYECTTKFASAAKLCCPEFPDGIKQAKTEIQVYLAAHKTLVQYPVGIAASRGAFPFDNAAFQPLKDFLLAL